MFSLTGVAGKKYAVFGLGRTGRAACAALSAAGADVFSWDEAKAARAATEGKTYEASHPKEWPWDDLVAVVLSPGVPLTHPKPHVIVRKAAQKKVPVIGDLELFALTVNAMPADARPRVIAVTGSNGKSTTTALIGHILKESGRKTMVGGNIGEPLLSLAGPSDDATYVLELSSYQLELSASFRPDVAALLNISPDHLDRHGTMENYVAAKSRIFARQTNEDCAIVGVDDTYVQGVCAALARNPAGPAVLQVSSTGALGAGVFALDGKLYYRLGDKTGEAGVLKSAALPGRHNAQNAAAALASVMREGVSPAVAMRSMERFKGLPHRSEVVAVSDGVAFVNDSKATNAAAAAYALDAYDEIYWIAGGLPKEGGAKPLRDHMTRVRKAYLIGQAAAAFATDLDGVATVVQCGDLETALLRAAEDAFNRNSPETPRSVAVLLSPACASQDQFRDYEHRGETFRILASRLVSARSDGRPQNNGEAA
ncbi:MAG: UDP-N-acetylmuramoyl-L-alanine--D-glutamate ligase [Alphaproteobacteria bacterium]|nr:UDP-N-acetylmuramoyl-L-alanine--D-glutamate ligase [Alphaproteobacteria bacterium]